MPVLLRRMAEHWKQRTHIGVEVCWETRNRNVRIPGQQFMGLVRIHPDREWVVPVTERVEGGERERNNNHFALVVDAYEKLEPVPAGELFGCRLVRREGRAAHSAPKATDPGRRRPARPAPSNTAVLAEPDTFKALHDSKVLQESLREFGWDPKCADDAVERMALRFRAVRPASSRTCGDPCALRAFLKRHYLWGCRTYDPSKAGKGRTRARAEDEARIAGSLRLNDRLVEAYLSKVRGLGKSELTAFRRFRVMEREYAGRISCGTLYSAFGSQRRYQRFIGHGILRVTDEYSTGERKCRQWTLTSGLVRAVRTLAASPWLR